MPSASSISSGASIRRRTPPHYQETELAVYEDGLAALTVAGDVSEEIEDLEAFVAERRLTLVPPEGALVIKVEKAVFMAIDVDLPADPEDVTRNARNVLAQLRGEPSALERCRSALGRYLERSSKGARVALKAAYEAIPTHLRMYVVNAHCRDLPLKKLLYGKTGRDRAEGRAVLDEYWPSYHRLLEEIAEREASDAGTAPEADEEMLALSARPGAPRGRVRRAGRRAPRGARRGCSRRRWRWAERGSVQWQTMPFGRAPALGFEPEAGSQGVIDRSGS